VLNAAPYGSGILAKGPDNYARYAYEGAMPETIAATRAIEEVCQRHAVPIAAVALQVSLRQALIDVTIVGMSRPERIQQTLELARWPLSEDLWREIAALPILPAVI